MRPQRRWQDVVGRAVKRCRLLQGSEAKASEQGGVAHLSDSMAATPELGRQGANAWTWARHLRAARRDNNNSALLFSAAINLT